MRRVILRGGVLAWLVLWAGCSPVDLGRPDTPGSGVPTPVSPTPMRNPITGERPPASGLPAPSADGAGLPSAPTGLCDPSPCLNGGRCVQVSPQLAYCACINGFTGSNCHVPPPGLPAPPPPPPPPPPPSAAGWCSPNPCRNGGTCVEIPGSTLAFCRCVSGYSGLFCETPPTPTPAAASGTATPRLFR